MCWICLFRCLSLSLYSFLTAHILFDKINKQHKQRWLSKFIQPYRGKYNREWNTFTYLINFVYRDFVAEVLFCVISIKFTLEDKQRDNIHTKEVIDANERFVNDSVSVWLAGKIFCRRFLWHSNNWPRLTFNCSISFVRQRWMKRGY